MPRTIPRVGVRRYPEERRQLTRCRPHRSIPRPVFEPLTDPDFFAKVHVDEELGTVVWPNGADLNPLVLHGDFEPAARFAHY
jgi:hypothetical protein